MDWMVGTLCSFFLIPTETFVVPEDKRAFVIGWTFYAKPQGQEEVVASIWRPINQSTVYRLVGFYAVFAIKKKNLEVKALLYRTFAEHTKFTC